MVELRYLRSVKTLLYQVFVVVFLMLLFHQFSHQINLLQLPIGDYPVDLLLDKVASLLLLDDHQLAGIFEGFLLVGWLLATDVVGLSNKDLVKVKDFKLLLVDALASIIIGTIFLRGV